MREAILATARPRCVYVYDSATLQATAEAVRAALPPGSTLLYAVKANGHPGVLTALADRVDGFEVASGGELALARAALAGRAGENALGGRAGENALGGRAGVIAFGGPAKTEAELAAAVSAGAIVNVESTLELRRLSAAARATTVDVALRVNRPGPGLSGSHRMTGEPTPFGIDEAQVPEAVALATALPGIRLIGFHLHAVSNNLDAAAHAAFAAEAVDWALSQAASLRVPIAVVNVGGGFGIDYAGDRRFDLDALANGLRRLPDRPRPIFEPGRFLAADAGWYAAEVLDLKRTHGRWFAVLRGGTHHFRLPAAWGYSHPSEVLPVDEWPHPYPRPEVRDEPVDLVGELCTPRDVLARGRPTDRLRVGDVVVFPRTGAYGWDISHHEFLRHEPPRFTVL